MQVGDLLAKAQKQQLRTEMEVFLAYLLQCERLDLVARPEAEVPVERLSELQAAWVKLLQGCPVAYLTNRKEFYGLDFYVDERVLVPRWETEALVDYVLERVEKGAVLEVGTGSGAIAVALKKTRPALRLLAGDVSAKALEVARENAQRQGVEVEFYHSDLLEAIPDEPVEALVANLPYIGTEQHHFVAEHVEQHEPHVALFGGSDGLRLYARLFEQLRACMHQPRWILGEFGFTQGEAMRALCESVLPDYCFELRQDGQGLDRHFILEKRA